jgi:membrane protein implicated in regulation of membrane protease activity
MWPVWLVAVIFLILGVVLGWIWRWMSRRRKRD